MLSNLAEAIFWKANLTEGANETLQKTGTPSILPQAFSGAQTVPLRFYELKKQLDQTSHARMPAAQKVNQYRKLLMEFSEDRKKMGFSKVSQEIEMDLFIQSIQFWINDPHFTVAKCATYKHQLLMRFEPQADLVPVVPPLDHSFQVLDQTCHSS